MMQAQNLSPDQPCRTPLGWSGLESELRKISEAGCVDAMPLIHRLDTADGDRVAVTITVYDARGQVACAQWDGGSAMAFGRLLFAGGGGDDIHIHGRSIQGGGGQDRGAARAWWNRGPAGAWWGWGTAWARQDSLFRATDTVGRSDVRPPTDQVTETPSRPDTDKPLDEAELATGPTATGCPVIAATMSEQRDSPIRSATNPADHHAARRRHASLPVATAGTWLDRDLDDGDNTEVEDETWVDAISASSTVDVDTTVGVGSTTGDAVSIDPTSDTHRVLGGGRVHGLFGDHNRGTMFGDTSLLQDELLRCVISGRLRL